MKANKIVEKFSGFGGRRLVRRELTEQTNAVSGHSILLPEFSVTFRVGELRKVLEGMADENGLTLTIKSNGEISFSYVTEEGGENPI